ncbi:MAG TPA: ATP-dependent DNA ligase [Nitrososphaeraceae archaeon]|nr:ATP-dependent DNA ligase [Nitrososphaeraceae archaeon]
MLDFSIIVNILEKMERTTSRLELTNYLVSLFKNSSSVLIDKIIYLIQGKIRPDYEGIELGIAEKTIIRIISQISNISSDEVYHKYREIGDLGRVAESILKNKVQTTLFNEKVTIERIYLIFDKVSKTTGKGSQEIKLRLLSSLFNDSSPQECKYIIRFALATLRLGIADSTIMDALALTYTSDKKNRKVLESAYNVSSDLGRVSKILARDGIKAVSEIKIEIFIPIRPMLAERVQTSKEALEKVSGKGAVEFKLDGERVQIHRKDKKVEIFSRSLENITYYYPDVAEVSRTITLRNFIIEAEVVAINKFTEEFLPFQELMHRRRKYDIAKNVENYPISVNVFDVLWASGRDKTKLPYVKRRELLEDVITNSVNRKLTLVHQSIVTSVEELDNLMAKSIEYGCEGLVVKQINSPYRAGARGFAWTKIKREYRSELVDSLDLVIIGGSHGRGRRVGKYGALLLAIFDKHENAFKSVCKVGSGFTDEVLKELFKELGKYKIPKKHPRVYSKLEMDTWFVPTIVIEIIASEITLSPEYDACMDSIRKGFGLSLRFPKFTKKIRLDKNPQDITDESELIQMYKKQRNVKL